MYPYFPQFISQRPVQEADTVDTTRVNHDDIYNFNTAVTKIIYPGRNISWRPHAVILVPSDRWQYGLCASSVIHFPINAPIMFTERFYLPPMILNEIIRLGPTGEKVPSQVLIIGPISPVVENQLRMAGLTTYRITSSEDVFRACMDIGNFRLNVVPPSSEDGLRDIMVVSGEDYSEGMPAAFYAAHMGVPVILVQQNNIPPIIQNFIANNRSKNYFILGSIRTVSENAVTQLRSMVSGSVERIGGADPYAISVNFAKYQSPVDTFGWKHNRNDGWTFTFGELRKWQHIISGALFAHLGKHSPLLLAEKDRLPDVVRNYLIYVNPQKPMPHMPPYMHGYILGGFNDISHPVQVEIEKVLNIQSKM